MYYANRKLKAETVDRYVYLCDGMIIICKQNTSGHGGKRSSVSSQAEYRYCDCFLPAAKEWGTTTGLSVSH